MVQVQNGEGTGRVEREGSPLRRDAPVPPDSGFRMGEQSPIVRTSTRILARSEPPPDGVASVHLVSVFALPHIPIYEHAVTPPRPLPASAPALPIAQHAELDALILRAQKSDEDAAAELLLRFRPLVHATQVKILGPDAELHDLVQETYLRAITHLKSLREPRGFANWLKRIATHVALDHLRTRKRQSWLSIVDPLALPEVPTPSLDETKLLRVRRIYVLLDQLPSDDRAAFSLRWLAEHELAEVAELCGCSLATAKRRIARGQEFFTQLAQKDPVLCESQSGPCSESKLP